MEKEVKENNIPGFWLSTFLFVFFYILLRTFFSDIPEIYYYTIDSALAEGESVVLVSIMAFLEVVMLCLSFWSIIRVLKKTADALYTIKFALWVYMIVGIYHFFKSLGNAMYIHWALAFLPAFQVFFSISFLLYLKKSKTVNGLLPKNYRKFLPGGLLWILFLVLCSCFVIFLGYQYNERSNSSKRVDIKTLNLKRNMYSDGLMIFKSSYKFDKKNHKFHNTDYDEYGVQLFSHVDDSIKMATWCGVSEKSRHYDYASIMLQAIPNNSRITPEIWNCDTTINNCQLFVDQFIMNEDSVAYLWTFGVRFDNISQKYCAISRYVNTEKTEIEFTKALKFLEAVEFDLSKYQK